MKKIILTFVLSIFTLMANTIDNATDIKIMDKVYLDIHLGDEVNYQYVQFSNNFNLKTKKLNQVFELYRTKGLDEGKFTITGKFELPHDVGNKVAILIQGTNKTSSTLYSIKTGILGVHTYLNDVKLLDKKLRNIVDVVRDDSGIPYVDIRIETEFISRELFLSKFRHFISSMKFSVIYEAQQLKRGDTPSTKELPLRAFVLKDDNTFKYAF